MAFQIGAKSSKRDEKDFNIGLRMSRSDREALSGKELLRTREYVTAPIASLFANVLPKQGIDGLGDSYDLQIRTFQYKERLGAYEMLPVFEIMTEFDSDDYIVGDGAPINLFCNPSGVSVAQVRKSNLFYRAYGPETTVTQDLDWSATLMENSSEQDLRHQYFERLVDVPLGERGGPLLFKLMMEIATSVSPATIESLVTTLRKLSLQDEAFRGEDVDRINQLVRGTVNRLRMVDAVPKDIFRLVCLVYQTSSSSEFNATFQLLATLFGLKQSTTVTNLEELLAKGEEEYSTLLACDSWSGVNRREKKSVFSAGLKDVCRRCGEEGHFVRDCPLPLGPLRIAPKGAEATTKDFANSDGTTTTRMWCSKCGLWNKTHLSTDHRTKAELATEKATPGPSASFAAIQKPRMESNPKTIAAAHAAYKMMAGLLEPSSHN